MNARRRAVVDLSHQVRHGMVTYPGLPGPSISDYLSRQQSREMYAPGTEFHIGQITLVANTGTYLDAPSHRFPDGADLSELPLSGLVDLRGFLLDTADERRIDADVIKKTVGEWAADIEGAAVLVRTGWDRHWGTDAYVRPGHPYLTTEAVRLLVSYRPALVGIDSVNVDDVADSERPAHTGLLAEGIPVIEHLTCLGALPRRGFTFHAAPVAIAGMGTFPVRAYALIDPS